MRQEDEIWGVPRVVSHLAMLALDQGDYSRAETLLLEGITVLRKLNESWQTLQTLELFACLTAEQSVQMLHARTRLLLPDSTLFAAHP